MKLFKRNKIRFMVVGMIAEPKPGTYRTAPEYMYGIFKTKESAQKFIDNSLYRAPYMEIRQIIFE